MYKTYKQEMIAAAYKAEEINQERKFDRAFDAWNEQKWEDARRAERCVAVIEPEEEVPFALSRSNMAVIDG